MNSNDVASEAANLYRAIGCAISVRVDQWEMRRLLTVSVKPIRGPDSIPGEGKIDSSF